MRNEGRGVAAVLGTLPFGWATATIGDIIGCGGLFADGDWVESKDQDPKGDVRLTQLADVGDGIYRNKSNRFLKYEKAVQLGCTFLQPNDLMVARMPDPLGRACIFPGDSKPSVTAVDVCIVRTGVNGADHQWLMHTINSPKFRSAIASLQSGSTRKRISRSNLAKIEFPLPPLPEQRRIVAKIEELFTKLDAGIDALNKIKLQLRQYRQAVLKHAFKGKLTEEWRESHKDELENASVLLERIKEECKKNAKREYKELPPLDTSDLPELPRGWMWTRLGEICLDPQYGWTTSAAAKGSLRLLRTTDITSGDIHWDAVPFCKEEPPDKQKYLLKDGDIVISRAGSIGYSHLIKTPKEAVFASYLIRFRPLANEVYLAYFLKSPSYWESISEKSLGIAIPNVNASKLKQVAVPLSPPAEQQKIVEEIERCFSIADEIEKVVEQSLMRAERLRQSILKKAFEGRLVPQDPNDESAEKLLERIKTEKARREAAKKAAGIGRKRLNAMQGRLM